MAAVQLLWQDDVEWAEQQLTEAQQKLAVSGKLAREIQRRLGVLKAGLAAAAPSAWQRKRARSLRAMQKNDADCVAS